MFLRGEDSFVGDDIGPGLLEWSRNVIVRNRQITHMELFYGPGHCGFQSRKRPVVAVFARSIGGAHIFWCAEPTGEPERLGITGFGHLVDHRSTWISGSDESGDLIVSLTGSIVDGTAEQFDVRGQ